MNTKNMERHYDDEAFIHSNVLQFLFFTLGIYNSTPNNGSLAPPLHSCDLGRLKLSDARTCTVQTAMASREIRFYR